MRSFTHALLVTGAAAALAVPAVALSFQSAPRHVPLASASLVTLQPATPIEWSDKLATDTNPIKTRQKAVEKLDQLEQAELKRPANAKQQQVLKNIRETRAALKDQIANLRAGDLGGSIVQTATGPAVQTGSTVVTSAATTAAAAAGTTISQLATVLAAVGTTVTAGVLTGTLKISDSSPA